MYSGNKMTLGEKTYCDLRGDNQKDEYVRLSDCEIYIDNQKSFSRTTLTEAIATSSLTTEDTGVFYVGDKLRVYDVIDSKVVGTAKILEIIN
ncbi:hypothetical protein [uncultured Psychroserpens sp.]|uniref:hypothetical protein n=1 Tax=uncultured Psychroserpens sp. TaxID=255436 RepID=UPI002626A1CB|nr:hypothetical protein [uncultured Psychroserpens sp.]